MMCYMYSMADGWNIYISFFLCVSFSQIIQDEFVVTMLASPRLPSGPHPVLRLADIRQTDSRRNPQR